MPRAGSLRYPSRDLDDCVSYLRRARESLKSRNMSRDGFAQAIGLSPGGGGFGKLVAAMTEYGLVETGRNQIAATDLGEQILYGTHGEQRAGLEKSVLSVQLFSKIYLRFGREPTDDQLRLFLRESAGLEIVEAKNVAEEVEKLMRKNSVHLQAGKGLAAPAEAAEPSRPAGQLVGRLEMADYGILNIRDEISTDLAISLLTQVKKDRRWSESGKAAEPEGAGPRKKDSQDQ